MDKIILRVYSYVEFMVYHVQFLCEPAFAHTLTFYGAIQCGRRHQVSQEPEVPPRGG